MHVFCLHACKYNTCLSGAQGRNLIPWNWKLQMAVIYHGGGGAGNETSGPLEE